MQRVGSAPEPLEAGTTLDVAGVRVDVVRVEGADAGLPPVRIVTRYDSVQLHRDGAPVVILAGVRRGG